MSLFRKKEHLKTQIIETERLLEMVIDHPIMAEGLEEKLNELRNKLEAISTENAEAKIRLLFSGNAVAGSIGIKSSFLSNTLKPFQEMVKTQASLIRFGKVGQRGVTKKGINSNLYLTALPLGSFGVELTQIGKNDLFDAQDMTTAMKSVAELINDASLDDDSFEHAIENTPKRNLTHLKGFLQEIYEEKSILKIECNDLGIEIDESKVEEAYHRVSRTSDTTKPVVINGIFRGILLDSGKFEVQTLEGNKISGFINPEIDEDTLIEYDRVFLNEQCVIHLQKHYTEFVTGRSKTDFELLEISELG